MLSEKVIPPKDEGRIQVTFSPGKRKGRTSQSITVTSNDPDEPLLILRIEGMIKQAVIVKPNRLDFGNVIIGDSPSRKLTVFPAKGEELKVREVESGSEHLRIKLSKISEEGVYQIDVTLGPEAPFGRLNERLIIYTDNERQPVVDVLVTANIKGDIVVTPKRLSLNVQKGEEFQSPSINITKVGQGKLKVFNVESNKEFIKPELQPLEHGKRYRVALKVGPNAPVGWTQGLITIQTDDPREPNIRVPINLNVSGEITVVPERIYFGLVNPGRPTSRVITLIKNKGGGLKITRVESSSNWLTPEIVLPEEVNRIQVKVWLKPEAPIGRIDGKITVHTNSSLQPIIEVPVSGNVRQTPARK